MLTTEDKNSLIYFMKYKDDPERWTGWGERKDQIIEEFPLLKLYLERELENRALFEAIILSIEASIDEE